MSPFERPGSLDLTDVLADGAVAVLRDRGVQAVNVAALARWMGIRKQTLHERLHDTGGTRNRILRLTVLSFGKRWLAWTRGGTFDDPPVPALPITPDEEHGVRVWHALAELARGEDAEGRPDPLLAIGGIRRNERDDLRYRLVNWLRAYVADDDLDELLALTEGVRTALVAPDPWLTPTAARRILTRWLEGLRARTPPAESAESA